MSELVQPPQKNYLLTSLVGSFWNIIQFAVTFVVGIIVSILLTRHFGAHTYGLLAYLIWFSTVTQLILNFGLLTTIQTWVPKYYFTDELSQSAFVARQLVKVQFIVILIGLVLLVPLILIWHRFVSFSAPEFTRLMIINILPIVSTILITFFSTLLVALQRFKQSAVVYIIGQVLSLLVVIAIVYFKLGLSSLLLALSAVNCVMLFFFIRASWDILHRLAAEWSGTSGSRALIRFSGWAYGNSIVSTVLWDKSAFFFLGKFQSGKDVAIYGIAYTLAATVSSLLDQVVNVFSTMFAELVAKNDWDRIRLIIRLCAKYVSLLLLPVVTLAYALSPYVVRFVYGSEFLLVASIFPWLLLASLINRVFAPAWSIPQYMDDLRRIVPRNVAVATLNLTLGALLIPRYGVWGAVMATVSTQLVALAYFSFFVRRYHLKLLTSEYAKIVTLNLFFFGLIFLSVKHQATFIQTVAITLVGVIVYVLFVLKKMITPEDRRIFSHSILTLKNRSAI